MWPLLLAAASLSALDFFFRLTFAGRALLQGGTGTAFVAAAEWTVPTLFTVAMMLWVGVAALRTQQAPRRAWRIFGALFCYLALDDLLSLHEAFGAWVYGWSGEIGIYVWVLTLGPVIALAGAYCAWHLLGSLASQRKRQLAMFAGFAALGLALGCEAAEDRVTASTWQLRGMPLGDWSRWVEETLELFGPILLLASTRATAASVSSPHQSPHTP